MIDHSAGHTFLGRDVVKLICLFLIAMLVVMTPGFFSSAHGQERPTDRSSDLAFASVMAVVGVVINAVIMLATIADAGTGIAGLITKGQPGDPFVKEEIEKLGKKIDSIIKTLDGVKMDLNDLKKQLGIDRKVLERKIKEVNINAAETEIDTFYGHFQRDIVPLDPGPAGAAAVEQFTKQVMDGLKIENDVNAIYRGICKTEPGVLDLWTDEAILKLAQAQGVASDFSLVIESLNGAPILVERPMYFDFEDAWDGGHDEKGLPAPSTSFYFAEGSCRPDFEPFFCIENAGDDDAEIEITYMKGDGETQKQSLGVGVESRSTVRVKDVLGEGNDAAHDFSARVESKNGEPVVVERPMYFNYHGTWQGGHDVIGATELSTNYFLAEGTCRPGFDPYICIQNPGDTDADVTITYMKGDGAAQEQALTVGATSRETVVVKDILGECDDEAHDFSARVESTNGQQILVERPMYFDYEGMWDGGHVVMGVPEPSAYYYFAEGCCRPGFESYLSLQNPSGEDAEVQVTYMRGDGTTEVQDLVVGASSRETVAARDVLGVGDDAAHDFSAQVVSINGVGIVAERPIYFNYKEMWDGGHCKVGAVSPSDSFYFAEGSIRPGFDSYLCIQNPGEYDVPVGITYIKGDGTLYEQEVTVGAESRYTVDVSAENVIKTGADYYSGLEKYFLELVLFQIQGCDLLVEAKTLHPVKYGKAETYLEKTFDPNLKEEVERFISCVERLVLSQVNLVNQPGKKNIELPPWASDALGRADLLETLILPPNDITKKKFGLKGRIIATEDMVARGDKPKISARMGSTTFNPSGLDWKGVQGVKAGGHDVVPRYYDQWDDDLHFRNNSEWSVVRYSFEEITEPGLYDILDSNGNPLVEGVEAGIVTIENMVATYGSFVIPMRKGGSDWFLGRLGAWRVEHRTDDGHSRAIAEPGKRVLADGYGGPPVKHYSATANLDRQFGFRGDRDVTVKLVVEPELVRGDAHVSWWGNANIDYQIKVLNTHLQEVCPGIDDSKSVERDGKVELDKPGSPHTFSFKQEGDRCYMLYLSVGCQGYGNAKENSVSWVELNLKNAYITFD